MFYPLDVQHSAAFAGRNGRDRGAALGPRLPAGGRDGRLTTARSRIEELFQRGAEIGVALFVETTALPDVGPTSSTCGAVRAFFKGVVVAFGVGFDRSGLAKKTAEIAEMLLRRLTLGERDRPPFPDEFLRCHSPFALMRVRFGLSTARRIKAVRAASGIERTRQRCEVIPRKKRKDVRLNQGGGVCWRTQTRIRSPRRASLLLLGS